MFCFPNSDHVIFSREFALCLSINYVQICAWMGRSLKKFSGARSRDLIEQTKQISWKGLFDIGFWESKWISAIWMVCAAVLTESETPLKRNPVLTIYISSSNAILLLLSNWFTTVAGPSLACGHPPITLLQKNGKRRRRWGQEGEGRRTTSRRRRRGGGGERTIEIWWCWFCWENIKILAEKRKKRRRGAKKFNCEGIRRKERGK